MISLPKKKPFSLSLESDKGKLGFLPLGDRERHHLSPLPSRAIVLSPSPLSISSALPLFLSSSPLSFLLFTFFSFLFFLFTNLIGNGNEMVAAAALVDDASVMDLNVHLHILPQDTY